MARIMWLWGITVKRDLKIFFTKGRGIARRECFPICNPLIGKIQNARMTENIMQRN